MKLTREEHNRLRAGDYSPIRRTDEPECTQGELVVLSWSKTRRYADPETGHVFDPPAIPVLMIQVTGKLRNRKGEWIVRFDVRDTRDHRRLVRRKPPATQFGDDEIEQDEDVARIESAYTTDIRAAVDHLDAVSDDDLDRFTEQARKREATDATDVVVAAEEVLGAIKERSREQPSLRRYYWPLRRELERMIEGERRKAA